MYIILLFLSACQELFEALLEIIYLNQVSQAHSINTMINWIEAKNIILHSASSRYHHLPERVVYLHLSLKFIHILYFAYSAKSIYQRKKNSLIYAKEFSGAGRETSPLRGKLSPLKSSKIVANYLTTPTNYDILLITLLYPAQTRIT